MPFFVLALLLIATIALSYLMRPKGEEARKPSSLGDFNFPTATEARAIPVIVGKILQRSPNCTWYGDLSSQPVTQKVANPLTFGLTKKKVETGQYRYFVGMDLGLAHVGSGAQSQVRLREFRIDDKTVWTGDITSGTIQFNASELFGGEKKEGGYAGTFDYYGGSWAQLYNAYLQTQNPAIPVSHQRGICHIIQRGASSGQITQGTPNGYVGLSANIKPYSFVLQRLPDHLGQSQYTQLNDGDANPIEWLYEVLTDADYGMGVAAGMVDIGSFRAAAVTCFNEGMGLSVLWDMERDIEAVVNDIVKLVDGACYVDRSTGLWTCVLMRYDYDPATLPVFDESNILEYLKFSVNTLDETTNQVVINYVDKANGYKERPADFKDLANRRLQGAALPHKMSFYGLSFGVLAARISFRECKAFSSNLRQASFKIDRHGHWLRPGSVFKYARVSQGITAIIMRAIKINDGELVNGEIEVECIQDIFSLGNSSYAPPPLTSWQNPVGDAMAVAFALIDEQPYFYSGDEIRLWAMAAQPNGSQINFDSFVSEDNGANYTARENSSDYAPTGTLAAGFAKRTAAVDTSDTLRVTKGAGMVRLQPAGAVDVARGQNNFRFADTGEIGGFETFTDNGDGTLTLHRVWRGLHDTVPEAHAAGARIFFFSYGDATPDDPYRDNQQLYAKLLPNSFTGQLPLAQAAALALLMKSRALRPLAPANVRVAGVYNATVIPAAGEGIAVAWSARNRRTQVVAVTQVDTGIAPETNQATTIKVYGETNQLLGTYENLAGEAWTYTAALASADGADAQNALTFVLFAVRDGLSSWQAQRVAVVRPTGSAPASLPAYSPSGSYTPPAGAGGGSAYVSQGNYQGGTNYHTNDTVQYGGATYLAIAPSNGVTPGTNSSVWQLMAAAGQPGAKGDKGDKGDTGGIRDLLVEGCEMLCDDDNDYLYEEQS